MSKVYVFKLSLFISIADINNYNFFYNLILFFENIYNE